MGPSTLKHVNHNYKEGSETTVLNTVDVWLPESNHDGNNVEGKWVIFIHGGAWRDPLIDSTSFKPTVDILSTLENGAVGFASINYRLSPYPDHPTDPSSLVDPSRNAEHPDHLNDVTTALIFLEQTYRIADRYLLVGHSCGATLAFQIPEKHGKETVPQPSCIIGSEGIYDLPSLISTHQDSPFSSLYLQFVVSAFGETESAWIEASPCEAQAPAIWAKTKVLLISHSEEDDLVEKQQSLKMLARVTETKEWDGQATYVPVFGKHDEIHEKGVEMARIIEEGLGYM